MQEGGLSAAAGTTLAIEEGSSLRWRLVGLVLEKIPLLALGRPVFALQSMTYEKTIETVFPEDHVPTAWRIANGLVAYPIYLGQIVCPVHLTPLYLHPGANLPLWKIVAAAVLLLGISVGALVFWRRCPYLLIGWLWYVGMLVPVSGVIEFGGGVQAMADRFTYLPQIGVYLAFAWAVADLCRSWSWRRWVCGGAAVLALAMLTGCAWRQTSFWRDSETMGEHMVACFPRQAVGHHFSGPRVGRPGPHRGSHALFSEGAGDQPALEPRRRRPRSRLGCAGPARPGNRLLSPVTGNPSRL